MGATDGKRYSFFKEGLSRFGGIEQLVIVESLAHERYAKRKARCAFVFACSVFSGDGESRIIQQVHIVGVVTQIGIQRDGVAFDFVRLVDGPCGRCKQKINRRYYFICNFLICLQLMEAFEDF